MYHTRGEYGDAESGKRETRGFFEFMDNCVGIFTTTHEQRGRFIAGRIEVSFSGADGMALAGLNNPDIAQALGFRDNVGATWEDIANSGDDLFDRCVSICYELETLGERVDYEDLRRVGCLDIAAIDAFLDRVIQAYLRMCPDTATPAS